MKISYHLTVLGEPQLVGNVFLLQFGSLAAALQLGIASRLVQFMKKLCKTSSWDHQSIKISISSWNCSSIVKFSASLKELFRMFFWAVRCRIVVMCSVTENDTEITAKLDTNHLLLYYHSDTLTCKWPQHANTSNVVHYSIIQWNLAQFQDIYFELHYCKHFDINKDLIFCFKFHRSVICPSAVLSHKLSHNVWYHCTQASRRPCQLLTASRLLHSDLYML